MIFDTDVLIWAQRGNAKAVQRVTVCENRQIATQTYMELLQAAHNRRQQEQIKGFLREAGFSVLSLSEKIGHRACVYIEQYSLSDGLRAGDALVAATAAEHGETLLSGNHKHYRRIPELKFVAFSPQ
jgi:predicted nucleic acid-binding protein